MYFDNYSHTVIVQSSSRTDGCRPMQIITRLQYVAAQTFHELTNADLTFSIGRRQAAKNQTKCLLMQYTVNLPLEFTVTLPPKKTKIKATLKG